MLDKSFKIDFKGSVLSPLIPISRVDERRTGAEHGYDSLASLLT